MRTATNQAARQFHGNVDDLEDEHDGREEEPSSGIGDAGGLAEQVDGEPSLGSFDRMENQENAYRVRDSWSCPEDGEHDPGHRKPTEHSASAGGNAKAIRRRASLRGHTA